VLIVSALAVKGGQVSGMPIGRYKKVHRTAENVVGKPLLSAAGMGGPNIPILGGLQPTFCALPAVRRIPRKAVGRVSEDSYPELPRRR